jgi:hypothetical protein
MPRSYPKPVLVKGLYHPEKYQGDASNIVSRSSWEMKLCRFLDLNPSVIKWASEELVIPYWSQADNKMRRYFTDYVVQVKGSSGQIKTFIVEVKPYSQTIQPKRGKKREATYLKECYDWQVNQDKWAAATEYAKNHSMEFKIFDEYTLGISKRKK